MKKQYAVYIKENPSQEEVENALRHCPIVRMGKCKGNSSGEVIPKESCINCGICVVKSKGAVKMLDW